MAAYRIFDIFNAKIGTTQVVGADTLTAKSGYRQVTSNNDGAYGEVRDKTYFYAEGSLACQDIGGFPTLIGLFEAADNLAVLAEGKLAGDVSKSVKLQLAHAKLTGAQLAFRQGQHASTTFNFTNSCAPASTKPEDELTVTEVVSKTITHAAGLRGVRILGASFAPAAGGTLVPLSVTGLDLNLSLQAQSLAGDNDFGESVEVAGGSLTGTLTFNDETIGTNQTIAQRLCAAGYGSLAITYAQQVGGANQVLTLAALQFESDQHNRRARQFHENQVSFGCLWQVGSTFYQIATGANKLVTVAAA